MLVMRNISNIDKKYIISCFDLKGSTVDREVLNKNPNAFKEKKTLKDLDFFKIEKKCDIGPSIGQEISNIL